MLLDTKRVQLSKKQISLLLSTPFRVINGRNSFFSTIFSGSRSYIRFDPGCMNAVTPIGKTVLRIFSHLRWSANIEKIYWKVGMVLVIDNWRILHGRGSNRGLKDDDRKILRVSIK